MGHNVIHGNSNLFFPNRSDTTSSPDSVDSLSRSLDANLKSRAITSIRLHLFKQCLLGIERRLAQDTSS